jgi:hypothetical protein
MRTIGNRVRVTPPRVRIPPSPPVHALCRRWPATCGAFVCRFVVHAATSGTRSQLPASRWAALRRLSSPPDNPRQASTSRSSALTSTRRHGTTPIATAARAHGWRRHQQCPPASSTKARPNTNPAPGACLLQYPTRHPILGSQMPKGPLIRWEWQKLDFPTGVLAAKRSTRPAAELAAQRTNNRVSLSK